MTHYVRVVMASTIVAVPMLNFVRAAIEAPAVVAVSQTDDQQTPSEGKQKNADNVALSTDDSAAETAGTNGAEPKQDAAGKTADSKPTDAEVKSDKSTEAKADQADKSAHGTYTVKKGPFKVDLIFDGVFESRQNTEIIIHPETWSDWTVQTAIEHGTSVKQGDTLIEFDTSKIDEDIRDQEADRKLAQLSIDQLASEIRLLEQSMPLDLKEAEHGSRRAADDLNQFLKQDRDLFQRKADFTVKMAGDYLDYAKEELKQLEKMYKGDDITKETEEIVLKRTRDQVERMQFNDDLTKIEHDKTLKIELPRREELLRENTDRTAMQLQKATTSLPITLDEQRLELEKRKLERAKSDEKLAKLRHDRELMKVTSPSDGLVYFGACVRGRWSQGDQLMRKLRKGGHILPDEVVLTIVDPNSMFVRVEVPEKDLWQLRRGLTGVTTPEGYSEQHLPACLDEFRLVPGSDGKYSAVVLVDFARLPKDISIPSAGMNCKTKLTAYSSGEALTVAAKAVQTDAQNDEQKYVWLVGADGKPTRRDVKLGHRTDKLVEIAEGLVAGDKVLLEPPADQE
jgi:HlyD family secretion protein